MLELLLPKGKKRGRPPIWTRRQLINGIRFRVRAGIPWRDMPAEYGPWGRAYDLFCRRQRNGTWPRIFTELQARADAKDLITWDLNVDSTVCRAASTPPERGCGINRLKGIVPWPRGTTSSRSATRQPPW